MMADTQVTWEHRMEQVLGAFEERQGEDPPFVGLSAVLEHMKGSTLDAHAIGIAIARLVCERRLRYDLDGIRLVPQ